MMAGIKEYDERDATAMRNFQRSFKALFDRFSHFIDTDKLVIVRTSLVPSRRHVLIVLWKVIRKVMRNGSFGS